MKGKFAIFLFLFLFLISFTSAFSQSSNVDITIPINASISSCNITVQSPTTQNLIVNQVMTINVGYANYTLNSTYTSSIGTYSYFSDCGSGNFQITPNGDELTLGKGLAFGIIILVLVIFMVICLYFFKESDNLRIQLFNFGMAYLILTLLFFVLWQFNENYLIFGAINVILKWIFIIMMIGFFVLFVLMMMKVLKEMYDNKDVQRLMKKGMTEDEARERVRRKRRGRR